jgi:hypothetical protein
VRSQRETEARQTKRSRQLRRANWRLPGPVGSREPRRAGTRASYFEQEDDSVFSVSTFT